MGSAAKGLHASAGPMRVPSCFAGCTLGLGKCRQELSRQEATLQYDIYNSSGLGDFLSPLDRLFAIVERLLPASIETDFVSCHGTSRSRGDGYGDVASTADLEAVTSILLRVFPASTVVEDQRKQIFQSIAELPEPASQHGHSVAVDPAAPNEDVEVCVSASREREPPSRFSRPKPASTLPGMNPNQWNSIHLLFLFLRRAICRSLQGTVTATEWAAVFARAARGFAQIDRGDRRDQRTPMRAGASRRLSRAVHLLPPVD